MKKFLLSLMFVAFALQGWSLDVTYDLNGDGVVDPDDHNYMLSYYATNNGFPEGSDFNQDGLINVSDVVMLFNYLCTNPMNLDITPYIGCGDVNGDDVVDDDDFDLIQGFVMAVKNARNDWVCSRQYASYDITGDDRCDSWDLVILRMLIDNGSTTPGNIYDLNGDGVVDPDDHNYMLSYYATNNGFPEGSDFNQDGLINVSDVVMLFNYLCTNPMNLDITPYIGCGDVNGDDVVDDDDFDLIQGFVMAVKNARNDWVCSRQYASYDITGDDRCDSWDLVILRMLIDNGHTTPFVTGDITGEGVVDVADVNATINIILEQKTASDYSGNADLTGDGVVDVADVNAIINIILTQD